MILKSLSYINLEKYLPIKNLEIKKDKYLNEITFQKNLE